MLQLQMVIPSLKTDASVTGTLKKDGDVLMDSPTMQPDCREFSQIFGCVMLEVENVALTLKQR